MRSSRTMAKRVMQIARDVFGLQKENPKDLMSGPRMGDAYKMECALRLVMLEEEHRFRKKYPQLVQNSGTHKNIHEWVGPKPTTQQTGEPEGLPQGPV